MYKIDEGMIFCLDYVWDYGHVGNDPGAVYIGIENRETNPVPENRILYRVMGGSYKNRDNVERHVKKLKAAGFDAVIMIKGVDYTSSRL